MSWKVKFRFFQISTYSIVFVAIILTCLLTGKYIESIGFFGSFIFLRYSFDKTYHSKSFWNCIGISVLVLFFGIIFTPTKNTSILSCVIFGLLLDYIAYKTKDYFDLLKLLRHPFSVDDCTEEQLIKRCEELHLSAENKWLAVEFFIKKTKQSAIAEVLCVDEHAISTRKLRLKKKLNKNN